MKNDTTTPLQIPEASTNDVLSEILRDGAREMLGKAIEAEVADYLAAHAHERDADGHRLVVRKKSDGFRLVADDRPKSNSLVRELMTRCMRRAGQGDITRCCGFER